MPNNSNDMKQWKIGDYLTADDLNEITEAINHKLTASQLVTINGKSIIGSGNITIEGQTGAPGAKGDKGDKGDRGDTGLKGDKGDKGETGPQGPSGQDGTNGLDGQDGAPGQDGLTPYIGSNGTWWIGDTDTNVKAEGEDGVRGAINYRQDHAPANAKVGDIWFDTVQNKFKIYVQTVDDTLEWAVLTDNDIVTLTEKSAELEQNVDQLTSEYAEIITDIETIKDEIPDNLRSTINSYNSRISQNAQNITLKASNSTVEALNGQVQTIESDVADLQVQSGEISVEVAKKLNTTGNSQSFGWDLTLNGFKLDAAVNGVKETVFEVNPQGQVNIAGNININGYAKSVNTVKSVAIKYGLSDSRNTEPTQWTDLPEDNSDRVLWQKIILTKSDDTTEEKVACIQGSTGKDGKSINVKQDAAHCTEIGDGYISSNGHLMILTVLPDTFTDAGEIRGPQGLQGLQGIPGVQGEPGTPGVKGDSIVWLGTFTAEPENPGINNAYYNSTNKKSYIYDGTDWFQMTADGVNGQNGTNGISIIWKGELEEAPENPEINWAYRDITNKIVYIYNGTEWDIMTVDGSDGSDGTSMIFKGSYEGPEHPEDWEVQGFSYYNETLKASFVYNDNAWYKMSTDGVDGTNGSDGISIVWKGESATAPVNPVINWVYKDTDDNNIYIYTADNGWVIMTKDGQDGEQGAAGADGLSVFITYNDSQTKPSKPTGAGTSSGWHTDVTDNVIWMSQKVAESAGAGTWGNPIRIAGKDGKDGTSIKVKASAEDCTEIGDSYVDDTTGHLIMLIALSPNKEWKDVGSFKGDPGEDATQYYFHRVFVDDPVTGDRYSPTDDRIYIGTYTDTIEEDAETFDDATDRGVVWSRIHGIPGTDGNSIFITYNDSSADNQPSAPTGDGTTGGWHTTATSAAIWMSQKVAKNASDGTWGSPIRIHPKDGTDGNTPYIQNKYWYIDGVSTGIKAEGTDGESGADGLTPFIGTNGNWWIGTVDTGVKAAGTDGQDGADGADGDTIRTVSEYKLSTSSTDPTIYEDTWDETPKTPTANVPYVWARVKTYINDIGTVTVVPFLYQTLEGMVSILESDGIDIISKTGNKYYLKADNISGTIGNTVTISGFTVGETALESGTDGTNDYVHLGTDGIVIGNDTFTVDKAGNVYANSITLPTYDGQLTTINGNITTINGNITAINGDIDDLNTEVSEVSTTATSALSTANAAITEAQDASETAGEAYELVQDKSKTTYSTSTPTNPNSGDCWFNPTSKLLKQYNGSGWIDVGNEIVAKKVDAAFINALEINAGSITTGTLAADRIGANSITTSKIAAGAITADKIAAGAITADSIEVEGKFKAIKDTGIVEIGGFAVGTNAITAQDPDIETNNISIGPDGIILGYNDDKGEAKFEVTNAGALYAENATITGNVTATSGTIGGCTISNNTLKIKNANIDGVITAEHIDVGSLDANSITVRDNNNNLIFNANATNKVVKLGGFDISNNTISKGSITDSSSIILSADGISGSINGVVKNDWGIALGNSFGISKDGTIIATKGKLGATKTTTTVKFTSFRHIEDCQFVMLSRTSSTYREFVSYTWNGIDPDAIGKQVVELVYLPLDDAVFPTLTITVRADSYTTSQITQDGEYEYYPESNIVDANCLADINVETIQEYADGFTIGERSIYQGMTSLTDTTHDGVYLGTDGIAIGKGKFKVDNTGNLMADNGYFGSSTQFTSLNQNTQILLDGTEFADEKYEIVNNGSRCISYWIYEYGDMIIKAEVITEISSLNKSSSYTTFDVSTNGVYTVRSKGSTSTSNIGIFTVTSGISINNSININKGYIIQNIDNKETFKLGLNGLSLNNGSFIFDNISNKLLLSGSNIVFNYTEILNNRNKYIYDELWLTIPDMGHCSCMLRSDWLDIGLNTIGLHYTIYDSTGHQTSRRLDIYLPIDEYCMNDLSLTNNYLRVEPMTEGSYFGTPWNIAPAVVFKQRLPITTNSQTYNSLSIGNTGIDFSYVRLRPDYIQLKLLATGSNWMLSPNGEWKDLTWAEIYKAIKGGPTN